MLGLAPLACFLIVLGSSLHAELPGLLMPTHPRLHPAPLPPSPCAGKKRLLRKCEYRRLPTRVATLATTGSRIYVGDGQESMLYMR